MSDVRQSAASKSTSTTISIPSPALLAGFGSALFLSALLLFAVQPMFAKMVLPVLGGSPAVWSIAMCFFQAALLGGYAYAHWLNKSVRTPVAVVIHLAVMLLAFLVLPLGLAAGWDHPPESGLYFWVLGLFGVSIGLPFFALAGNAPLLQAWFARTGHKHAEDPYFLYGSSNLGSLLALLSYPILVEPAATIAQQSASWSMGYKLLAVLIGFCGLAMLISRKPKTPGIAAKAKTSDSVTWSRCLGWMGYAFVPSGLLVAVTSHITTDVAAAPFLWVLPLALFLLTFVITFQRKPIVPHSAMLAIQPFAVGALVISMMLPMHQFWIISAVLHLAVFFICTMVCHGELVRSRPGASDLTKFYLWMSLGGAAGGFFTGLIAPQIFSTILEYPLMIALTLLARPGFFTSGPRTLWRESALAIAVLTAAIAPKLVFGIEPVADAPILYIATITILGVAIILSRPVPARLAGIVATTIVAGHVLAPESIKGSNHRGFFGVVKIVESPDGKFRLMKHGTTLHGAQTLNRAPGTPPEPLTYFHTTGPFADVIRAARSHGKTNTVGTIGLGTGSLACYRRNNEVWNFFEIDPIIANLASDPKLFNFLSDCAPEAKIIIGDARLTLEKEPAGFYNLLILDAFSSDAIPVHLLTREALTMYLSRLSEGGMIAFHISNRNMDLRPALAAAARELGLTAMTRHGGKVGELRETYKSAATLVAMAREEKTLLPLKTMEGWVPLEDKGWRIWTDDYSNVLKSILASAGEERGNNSGNLQQ